MQSGRSLINTKKKRGLKMQPWGAPLMQVLELDKAELMKTD